MAENYKSHLRSYRISARKARLVVDMVRGKHVQDALDTLAFMNKKVAPIVRKLIHSAMANAQHKSSVVDVDRLVVERAFVNEGPTLKRFIPRAQGRAAPIRKRSSHITIELRELT
jgi:large subunit ribosomal protein L22